jgi:phosphonate utilization associated putative membrane protein
MTEAQALAAVGVSVLMHVTWNLIARHQPAASEPLWWVLLGHGVLVAPWAIAALWSQASWSPRLAGLLAVSALANVAYFHGLQQAYRHAPVAMVYPLVRSAPLPIAVWAALLFGERLPPLAWAGIAISVAGLVWMARTGSGRDEGRAVPWTVLAMLSTSVYSLSDKAATAHLPGFAAVLGYLSVGYLAAFASFSVRLRVASGRWRPPCRPHAGAILAGSLCIGLAYALVIHAMRVLPAAEVVGWTNAGLVLAALASMAVFGERMRWRQRLGATGVITIGLLCLGLARALAA